MTKKNIEILFNSKNERVKYRYRNHIRRALEKDDKTVNEMLKHVRGYEIFTGFADFSTYDEIKACKYVDDMINRGLSLSYITENIRFLKDFLRWLERQKGYRSKITYDHIDYLNVSGNQRRMAKAVEYKKSYTYEQIFKTIRLMPVKTLIDHRNVAMVSLQALCGLRISELRTVKLKNIICEDGQYFVYVNPKDMEVKGAKTRHAIFMPLPQDILDNVLNWIDYLRKQGFKDVEPLFPQIPSYFNQYKLLEPKLEHECIKSNTTIRTLFHKAFKNAGYEPLRVHSFRHTIVRYAEKQSPEFLNAIRQSLGHSSIDTTFQSYGELSAYDQRRVINRKNMIDKFKNC